MAHILKAGMVFTILGFGVLLPVQAALEIPQLRPYEIDRSHNIWHAKDPSSYITPENEWVKNYASQLYVDYDGRIKYIGRLISWLVDTKGNILLWADEPFVNNYISDDEQFHFPPNGDVWIMPDYYLTHGMQDDCDGWMVTVTSLMLSGEMFVWQDGKLVKQVIPAKAVLGYVGNVRDGWIEYRIYDETWITSTSRSKNENGEYSVTIFIEKAPEFKGIFEFTNEYFRSV